MKMHHNFNITESFFRRVLCFWILIRVKPVVDFSLKICPLTDLEHFNIIGVTNKRMDTTAVLSAIPIVLAFCTEILF